MSVSPWEWRVAATIVPGALRRITAPPLVSLAASPGGFAHAPACCSRSCVVFAWCGASSRPTNRSRRKRRRRCSTARTSTGLTTWLKESKRDDPKKVFRVTDGQLHITGDGFGYIATEKAYKDYRVVVEYKWGKKTDGGKYVRNSGLLLNAIGPDGGANGTWMSCVECQLAQGCCGDLIVIRGKDEKGATIPVSITSDVELGTDKRPRWKEGGDEDRVHQPAVVVEQARGGLQGAARHLRQGRRREQARRVDEGGVRLRGRDDHGLRERREGEPRLRREPRGREDSAPDRGVRAVRPQVRASPAEEGRPLACPALPVREARLSRGVWELRLSDRFTALSPRGRRSGRSPTSSRR